MAITSQAMLLLLLLSAMALAASAEVYTVAGKSGSVWGFGDQWPLPMLKPDDTIFFKYQRGEHNVVPVSYEDYKNCVGSNAKETYTSGDDYITLTRPGSYYFICSLPGHCSAGMKIAVYVQKS